MIGVRHARRGGWRGLGLLAGAAICMTQACGAVRASDDMPRPGALTPREAAVARAQVWMPTNVPAVDIMAGPRHPGALGFLAVVHCRYDEADLGGQSPKFACVTGPDDELKVKYGGNNAEVYGEVAASRLLWVLGFGADRMYPVRVVCDGCPRALGGISRDEDTYIFDPAAIERHMPGRDFAGDDGWAWSELDVVSEEVGGAPRAHADALKLLAVFMQHTDSKADNQRLICLDATSPGADEGVCRRPFLVVHDVGLTFGKANVFNDNAMAMNLAEWAATPVWKERPGCVGNLSKSLTGTLEDPVISEAGRAFLADLLMQLSTEQIRSLFETARVHLRLRNPADVFSGYATADEWVSAFKEKRRAIVERRCPRTSARRRAEAEAPVVTLAPGCGASAAWPANLDAVIVDVEAAVDMDPLLFARHDAARTSARCLAVPPVRGEFGEMPLAHASWGRAHVPPTRRRTRRSRGSR